jgi:Transcriptional regulator PadR-like family
VRQRYGSKVASPRPLPQLGHQGAVDTFYPALHRLEDSGLLASTWDHAQGRRRRVYGLTDQSASALAAQQTEWRNFAGGMHAVLGWAAQAARPPAIGPVRSEPGQLA